MILSSISYQNIKYTKLITTSMGIINILLIKKDFKNYRKRCYMLKKMR